MVLSNIPSQTLQKQRQASDPDASVWVSAHAGSGKTHVLTQRVLRLLLAKTPPSRILCLTFTKAAAANMAARVFQRLAEWALLDDVALVAALQDVGVSAPTPDDLRFARRLFARTVETPGGLKIQTIHAFCERLLAPVPARGRRAAVAFDVADDDGARPANLRDEARARALDRAGRRRRPGSEPAPARRARVTDDCSAQAACRMSRQSRHRPARPPPGSNAGSRDRASSIRSALAARDPQGRDGAAEALARCHRGRSSLRPARRGEDLAARNRRDRLASRTRPRRSCGGGRSSLPRCR